MKNPVSPFKLFAVAASEWLLVLPATFLLGAAVLRQLQPPQYEPARTISLMSERIGPHISRAGAALLFLGLPSVAVIVGFAALLMIWRRSETMRQDVTAALTSLRRNLAIVLLGTGMLLAGTILAAVLFHIITD